LTKDSVSAYKLENGNCLVIYRTEELKNGGLNWTKIGKKYLKNLFAFNETPDREQLHQITMLKAVDLKDKNDISNLKPIRNA
jgi:hypothetical protein